MPGIISPVSIHGIEYEDGDVSLPLAVSAVRAAGADFVIAVKVHPRLESMPVDAGEKLREQNARRRQQIAPEIAVADFVTHPDTAYYASPRQQFFEQSRKIGEAEARARLPALLNAWKGRNMMKIGFVVANALGGLGHFRGGSINTETDCIDTNLHRMSEMAEERASRTLQTRS